jgi:hypothetical protein
MPSTSVDQSPRVVAARACINGFYLCIDDLWCRVESKPWLLGVGICLLLDQDDTNGHFAET